MRNTLKKQKNLKEIKRDASLKKILKAAKSVFVAHGYAGASMSQIAEKAKVAQGLIYHYFKDKAALWKAVKQDALEQAGLESDFGGAQAKTFEEFLAIVLKNRLQFYQQNPEIRTIVAWEHLQLLGTELFGVKKNYKGMWYEELAHLQKQNALSKSVDAQLLGVLITNAFAGVLDDIPRMYPQKHREKKQREYLKMLLQCLSAFTYNMDGGPSR